MKHGSPDSLNDEISGDAFSWTTGFLICLPFAGKQHEEKRKYGYGS